MRRPPLYLAFLWWLTLASSALGCESRFEAVTVPRSMVYQPFAPSQLSGEIYIDLSNRSDRACTVGIVMSASSAVSEMEGAGERLVFRLRAPSGNYLGRSLDLGQNSAIIIPPSTERLRVALRVELPPGQIVGPAIYTAILGFDLLDIDTQSRIDSSSQQEWLLSVAGQAQVTVAGASFGDGQSPATASVHFSNLSQGVAQEIGLLVRSNSGIRTTAVSENGGRLMHERLPFGVPYSVSIDGTPLDVRSAAPVLLPSARSLTGRRAHVRIEIGEISGRPAGLYRDTITISVVPN